MIILPSKKNTPVIGQEQMDGSGTPVNVNLSGTTPEDQDMVVLPSKVNNIGPALAPMTDRFGVGQVSEFKHPEDITKYKKWLEGEDILALDEMYGGVKYAAAERQSGLYLTGAALSQAVLGEFVGGTIAGLGYILNPQELYARAMGEFDPRDQNAISALGTWIQDKTREDWTPIHLTKQAEKGWAPGDATWWASGVPSIASSLSMMLPTMGVVKVIGYFSKLVGLSNKISKAAGLGIQTVGSAVTSRSIESAMESDGLWKEIYEESIADGMSEQEAIQLASNAAAFNYRANYANLGLDIMSWGVILKGVNFSRMASPDKLKTLAEFSKQGSSLRTIAGVGEKAVGRAATISTKFKNVVGQSPLELLGQGVLEGGEEYNQQWMGEEAKRYAQRKQLDSSAGMLDTDQWENFGERLKEYSMDRHTWDAMFWGFVGGIGFGGAAGALQTVSSEGNIQDTINRQQKLIERLETITSNIDAWKLATVEGDVYKAEKILNDLVLEHGYQSANDGILGLNIELLENISNMSKSELETLKWDESAKIKAKETVEKLKSFEKIYNAETNRNDGTPEGNAISHKRIINEYKLGEAKAEYNKATEEYNTLKTAREANYSDNVSETTKELVDTKRKINALKRYIADLHNTKSNASAEFTTLSKEVFENTINRINKRIQDLEEREKNLAVALDEQTKEMSPEVAKENKDTLSNEVKALEESLKSLYPNLEEVDKIAHSLERARIFRDSWQEEHDNFKDPKVQQEYVAKQREWNETIKKQATATKIDTDSLTDKLTINEEYIDSEGTPNVHSTNLDFEVRVFEKDGTFSYKKARFEKQTSTGNIEARLYNEDGTLSKEKTYFNSDTTVGGQLKDAKWGFVQALESKESTARKQNYESFKRMFDGFKTSIEQKQVFYTEKLKNLESLRTKISDTLIKAKNKEIDLAKQSIEFNEVDQKILDEFVDTKLQQFRTIEDLTNLDKQLDSFIRNLEDLELSTKEMLNNIPEDAIKVNPRLLNEIETIIQTQGTYLSALVNGAEQSKIATQQMINQLKAELAPIERILQNLDRESRNNPAKFSKNRNKVSKFIYNKTTAKDLKDALVTKEAELEQLQNALNPFNKSFEDLLESGKALKLTEFLWKKLYDGIEVSTLKPASKSKIDTETKEAALSKKEIDIIAPMKPFDGTISAFINTTTNEKELIKSILDHDATQYEPQLLFQRFIDEYNFDGEYKLRLVNRDQLKEIILNNIPEGKYRESLEKYVNESYMKDGVFTVLLKKDASDNWTVHTTKSTLATEDTNTILFSTLVQPFDSKNNLVFDKEGKNLVVKRPSTGTAFIDAQSRVLTVAEEQNISIEEATEVVKQELTNAANEFKTLIIDPVTKDKKSFDVQIADSGTGVLQKDKDNLYTAEEVFGNLDSVELKVSKKDNESFGNKVYDTTKGFAYVNYANRLIPTFRETLQPNDIDRIIRLLQYAMSLEKGNKTELDRVINELKKITYTVYNSKGKKEEKAFNFYIIESIKNLTSGVQIGEVNITKQELRNNNEAALNNLRTFLAKKYYQVDSKSVENNASIETYDVKDDKLVKTETLPYKEWILSSKNNNTPKVKFNLVKRNEGDITKITSPLIINRSFKLDSSELETQSNKKNSTEETKKKIQTVKTETTDIDAKKADIERRRQEELDDIPRIGLKNAPVTIKEKEKEINDKYDAELSALRTQSDVKIKTTTSEPTKTQPEAPTTNPIDDFIDDEVSIEPPKSEKKTRLNISAKTIKKVDKGVTTDTPTSEGGDFLGSMLLDEAPFIQEAPIDLTNEMELVRRIFPDLVIKTTDGPLDKGAQGVHVALKDGDAYVLVNSLASKGTLFHEAFHEFAVRRLAEPEYNALIDEAVNLAGDNKYLIKGVETKLSELSKREVEEFLAEEFRNFMLVGKDNYNFGDAFRKQSFFESLWNSLIQWIESLTGLTLKNQSEIVKVFRDLSEGKWAKSSIKNRPDLVSYKVGKLNVQQSEAIVERLNNVFLNTLFEDSIREQIDLENIGEYMGDVYNAIYGYLYNEYKENQNDLLTKAMLLTWKDLVPAHIKRLRQYQIRIDVENDVFSTLEDEGKKSEYVQGNKIDVTSYLPVDVQLLIASLTDVGLNQSSIIIKNQAYTVTKSVDYARTKALLHKRLANLDITQIPIEIAKMAKTHKHLIELLNRIGFDSNGIVKKNATSKELSLANKLFVQMAKADTDMITTAIAEGGSYNISEEVATGRSRMIDKWNNNLKGKSDSIFISADGKFKLNPNKPVKLAGMQKAIPFKELIIKPFKYTNTLNQNNFSKDFLNLFGIEFPDNYTHNKENRDAVSWISDSISKILKTDEIIYSNDIFDRTKVATIKEFNTIADALAKYENNFVDNSIRTHKGMQYAISLKNHLHRIVERLKNPETVSTHLTPFKDGIGNVGTYQSKWYDRIVNKKNVPNIVLLSSIGEEVGDKIEINDSKPGDLTLMEAISILDGTLPFMRSEARKLEYAFAWGKDYIDSKLSLDKQVDGYIEYLKGELLSAIAFRANPNFNKFVGKNDAVNLRFFKDIVPASINNALESDFDNDSASWEASVDNIINPNITEIRENIENYIEQTRDRLRTRFINNMLVSWAGEAGFKLDTLPVDAVKSYVNPNPSEKVDSKGEVTSTDHYIDGSELNKILDIINYHYSTGLLEQTKLITGDVSIYTKKDVSELHKRSTTFTSTKSDMNTAEWFIDFINTHYPRLDGSTQGLVRKEVTFNDVPVKSKYYSVYASYIDEIKAYDNMKEADGFIFSTLDAHRSMMLMSGIWNDNYDRTWAYEAQFGFRKAQEWENTTKRKNKFWTEEKFKEYFKEHIPEGAPRNKYYYKGEEIAITDIRSNPLPVEKFQGTGHIINEGYAEANRVDITKAAVGPLLPSVIYDTQLFHFWREATENKIDLIPFNSAKKGDKLGDSNGKLPDFYIQDADSNTAVNSLTTLLNDDIIPTEMSWADIGRQLEIDPSGKTKVTTSTQERRLVTINAYDGGEITPEMTKYEPVIEELNTLEGALVDRAVDKFLKGKGFEMTDGKLKLAQIDLLIDTIHKEVKSRQVPDNVVEGVDIIFKSSLHLFDTLPNKRQLTNLLQGLYRNNVISIKKPGDMLVQVPSTGLENSSRGNTTIIESNALRFYEPLDTDGNITNDPTKIASVRSAEAWMTLPANLIPYVEQTYKGTFEEKLSKFNDDIKTKGIFKDIRTYLANRIPGQHLNSIEVLEIAKFLSPSMGSTVVLPTEIVAKSGSDFDIDKLTTYFNNLRIDYKTKTPIYEEYSNDSEVLYKKYLKEVERSKEYRKLLKEFDLDPRDINLVDAVEQNKELGDEIVNIFEGTNLQLIQDIIIEESNIMPKEEFMKQSIIMQNSTEAVQNRLNELHKQLILAPENFASLITPNSSEIIKTLANKYNPKNEAVSKYNLFELDYNLNVAINQWNATALVGVLAVHNTSHALFQQSQVKLDSDMFKIFFEEFEHNNEEFSLGRVRDNDNLEVGNTIAALLTAAVDAGKETFPSIFRINFTSSTAGAWLMLNTIGQGKSKPMGFKKLTEFFTSEPVMKYERLSRLNEGKAVNNLPARMSKKDIIMDITGMEKLPVMLYELVREVSKAKNSENRAAAKTALIAKLQSKDIKLKSGEYNSNAFNTLDVFLYYQELAKELRVLQQVTRPDAGLPQSPLEMLLVQNQEQKLREIGLFDSKDIDNLFEKTFVGNFKKAHNTALEAFGRFELAHVSKAIHDTMWDKESGLFNLYGNLGLPQTKLLSTLQKIQNGIINGIIHSISTDNKALSDRYQELLMGDNSLAKRIQALSKKSAYSDNLFLQDIVPVINEFVKRRQNNVGFDYIKVFNTNRKVEDSNRITDSFRELIESTDPEVKQVALDIVDAAIMQSGVQVSPVSFFELIPAEIYQPRLEEILSKYLRGDETFIHSKGFSQSFMDKVFANLRNDTTIVPREQRFRKYKDKFYYNLKENGSQVHIMDSHTNAEFPYISMWVPTVTRVEEKKLSKLGRPIPRTLVIFKDKGTYIPPKKDYKLRIYEKINSMGDGMRFFEMNTESILPFNNASQDNFTNTQLFNRKPEKTITEQTQVSTTETINIYAGTNENAELSNFAIRPFTINVELPTKEQNIKFQSVEQAFHFYKTITANNGKIANQVLQTTNGARLKMLTSRRNLPMTPEQIKEWDNTSKSIMLNLMYDSYIQNPKAAEKLLATRNAKITHISPYKPDRWTKDFPEVVVVVRDMLRQSLPDTSETTSEGTNDLIPFNIEDSGNTVDIELRDKYFSEGRTISARQILSKISSSTHPLNKLAAHLQKYVVNDMNITIVPVQHLGYFTKADGTKDTAIGYYHSDTNTIEIAEFAKMRKGKAESTIIHEIIHGLSLDLLASDAQVAKDLKLLYNHALRNTTKKDLYGFTNPKEFVTELFTNATFIKELQSMPPLRKGIKEYKSLWQEIMDLFFKVLNLKNKETLYTQAFDVASTLIEQQAELASVTLKVQESKQHSISNGYLQDYNTVMDKSFDGEYYFNGKTLSNRDIATAMTDLAAFTVASRNDLSVETLTYLLYNIDDSNPLKKKLFSLARNSSVYQENLTTFDDYQSRYKDGEIEVLHQVAATMVSQYYEGISDGNIDLTSSIRGLERIIRNEFRPTTELQKQVVKKLKNQLFSEPVLMPTEISAPIESDNLIEDVSFSDMDVVESNKTELSKVSSIKEGVNEFSKTKYQKDRKDSLNIAELQYLENVLETFSLRFGLPYEVIFDENNPNKGFVDVVSYNQPTIIINASRATHDTPLHEYGHIFINLIKSSNKNLYSNLVRDVLNTKEGKQALIETQEHYINYSLEEQVEETIVELLGKYAKNELNPETGLHKTIKKIWDSILEFLSKTFNVEIRDISPNTSIESLSKLLANPNLNFNQKSYIENNLEKIKEENIRNKEALEKEFLKFQKIENPSIVQEYGVKIIINEKEYTDFINDIKSTINTLKLYSETNLLRDIENIKSEIETFEQRDNFNYDRYPLFTKILPLIHPNKNTALWVLNTANEHNTLDEKIKKAVSFLNEDVNELIEDLFSGYSRLKDIGLTIPNYYKLTSKNEDINSVEDFKDNLKNRLTELDKIIKSPEKSDSYYNRTFEFNTDSDTYNVTGKYKDGNISISFSSKKHSMSDANQGLFFKVLPKVIDSVSYMFSDLEYNTISFHPVAGESSKGKNLRLKGYNIFAKRLFGQFSIIAENENTTTIPIPEMFKNKVHITENMYQKDTKVERSAIDFTQSIRENVSMLQGIPLYEVQSVVKMIEQGQLKLIC